jgi:hypothetical protein
MREVTKEERVAMGSEAGVLGFFFTEGDGFEEL